MAPPPSPAVEQVAEAAVAPASSDAHRSLPTPFLTKTYQLVDDMAIDDVISWNLDGSTFVVWRPAEFARDLLPKYFKHNNFSSFVRQLNTYGFRKTVPDRWEFANDCFRRGQKQLLCDIQRRKVQAPAAVPAVPTGIPIAVPANGVASSPTNSGDEHMVLSPNSSPGAAPSTCGLGSDGTSTELVEENTRLRKENERLSHELSQMRNLCNNILLLMSKHASRLQHEETCAGVRGAHTAERPPPPSSPLELMPLIRCSTNPELPCPQQDDRIKTEESRSTSPRLFGVPLGLKRTRNAEDEDPAADAQPQHRRALEVKPEPVDPTAADSPQDRDHHRWRLHSTGRPNQRVCN